MDGVALVFIVEIAGILYEQILRADIKEQTMNIEPMRVPMMGISALNTRPALMDMLVFVGVVVAAISILYWYTTVVVDDLYDSLECACLGSGPNCLEAQVFSKDFWNDYWTKKVPGVFQSVDRLKAQVGSAGNNTAGNNTATSLVHHAVHHYTHHHRHPEVYIAAVSEM